MAVTGEEEEETIIWVSKHYRSTHSILLVGDGDFSFSLSLANSFGSASNIVATSLDSYDALAKKYSKAQSNVESLKEMEATILHGVDATKMKLHTDLKMRKFDRIVFNFPHAGFKGKEDSIRLIELHQNLVLGFLKNACRMLRPYGEIHISHKTAGPFKKWYLEDLALRCSLFIVERPDFRMEDYPGYNNKRGDGKDCDKPFPLGECSIFKFRIRNFNHTRFEVRMARGPPVEYVTFQPPPIHSPPQVHGIPPPQMHVGPFHLAPPSDVFSPPSHSRPLYHVPPPLTHERHLIRIPDLDHIPPRVCPTRYYIEGPQSPAGGTDRPTAVYPPLTHSHPVYDVPPPLYDVPPLDNIPPHVFPARYCIKGPPRPEAGQARYSDFEQVPAWNFVPRSPLLSVHQPNVDAVNGLIRKYGHVDEWPKRSVLEPMSCLETLRRRFSDETERMERMLNLPLVPLSQS